MTARTFVQHGQHETLKGIIHGASAALAALMCAYSVVAWRYRRESHLATNAIFYGALTVREVGKTLHHWT